jgi:hypothetical protein
MDFKILSADIVVGRNGPDIISLNLDFPSPFPKFDPHKLTIQFNAEIGTGEEYVKKNFDITPTVINKPENKHKFSREE